MQKLLLLPLPALGLAELLRIFASVLPIQALVKEIGGQHVDAWAMVRPRFNPHIYDPTPQQISALAGAARHVRTGRPLEDAWMERISSANPCMQVLDARGGLSMREMEPHAREEHGDEAEHHEVSGHNHAHGVEAPRDDHDEHDAVFDRVLS